ncbi:MAG: glycine cleavage system protein R [Planctomycetes bacterium]|nr:glycine cleavage system protein R [Planctomycetota bacterium]
MNHVSLVMTIIGPDRPGLVDSVAHAVRSFDGNWEESRMLHLSGQFAGICRITCPESKLAQLKESLKALEDVGVFSTVVTDAEQMQPTSSKRMHLNLIGLDRPGLLKALTSSIAKHGINVEELKTQCRCAPTTGEILFEADIIIQESESSRLDELEKDLDAIGQELMVDIHLEDDE